MARTISLKGGLKVKMATYNKITREITVYGDISYLGQMFYDLPLLRLLIQDVSLGNYNDEAFVTDYYCRVIPYLKPIRSFRDILRQELLAFSLSTEIDKLGKVGIQNYLQDLGTFSEKKALIKETKTAVNRLRAEKVDDVVTARKILEVMGLVPSFDISFELTEK